MRMTSPIVLAAALVAGFAFASVSAQAQNVRVRGTIEKVDGNLLTVKTREGSDLTLKLKDNAVVRASVKASLADVKAGAMVGITSMPQADGSLKAVEIHIFPAGQNVNQSHGPWDLLPNSLMTNGAVQTSVAGVDGQVLTISHKSGDKPAEEKKVMVTPQTIIAGYAPATKADLKVGQKIFVFNAPKLPDGTIEVATITFGRDIAPPM
jgi:Domain of unknown function (DUF5666)